MTIPTRSPILLPWIAKKAGIPQSEAMALWLEALVFAGGYTGINSPAYFKLAVDTWLEAVARRCLQARELPTEPLPMIDWQQVNFFDVGSWINPWYAQRRQAIAANAVLPAPTCALAVANS